MAFLGAGWALVGCGLVFWGRHRGNAVGPLLVAAGFAWFLAEWDSPGVDSAPVFTVGLVFYASSAPLAAWAVLAYPTGRLASRVERAAVGLALAGAALVLGLLPALLYDPATFGCSRCADNLLLVADEPGRFDDLGRLGIRFGLAWSLLLIAVAAWKAARSSPDEAARRRAGCPGGVRVPRPRCRNLRHEPRARVRGQRRPRAAALARPGGRAQPRSRLQSPGACSGPVGRARRSPGSSSSLGESPPPGRLRDAGRRDAGRPDLEIAYPIGESRYVDARGRPVGRAGEDGRAATPARARRPHRRSPRSTDRPARRSASSSRKSRRRRDWRSRTSASRPRRAHSSRTSASSRTSDHRSGRCRATPARARPPRRRSATSRRAVACAAPHALAPRNRRRRRPRRAPRRGRDASCAVRSTSCATSPMASIRPCSPTKASPPPLEALAERPTSVARHAAARRAAPGGRRDSRLHPRRRGREAGPASA